MTEPTPTRPATDADRRALRIFLADLAALDWREGVRRFVPCRRGLRLCELGWATMYRPASRSTTGLARGQHHPATYCATEAAREVLTHCAQMPKSHLRQNRARVSTPTDLVYTKREVAAAIVRRYNPTGRVLDPCEGGGAFSSLIPGCLTCEITKGTDFFAWTEPVDWIVGNPPYSILTEWLAHSFTLAHDIVYLLPIAKVFGSRSRLKSVTDFGLVEVWTPWTGRDIGFPFGWACGAVHLRRGHMARVNIDLNL